ncbi:MAG: hypothetical protein HKM89_05375 [Gemmatimonadales bacterium]|nr:hypothetical protein [Gemmatimonadales bacterium]
MPIEQLAAEMDGAARGTRTAGDQNHLGVDELGPRIAVMDVWLVEGIDLS